MAAVAVVVTLWFQSAHSLGYSSLVPTDGASGSPTQFGLSHFGRSMWISFTMRVCTDDMGSHTP